MRAFGTLIALIGCFSLMAPAAWAEGGSPDSGKTVTEKAKPKARYRAVIKPSKPATKTPPAPIANSAPQSQNETPPPPPPPSEQASSVYDLPSNDVPTPLVSQGPLPEPIVPKKPLVADALPPSSLSHEDKNTIILKCDTVVFSGSKARSSGSFYIGLFPLELNPEEWADFRVYRVDPRHETLLRRSACLDKRCSAQVNATAYFLVNQSDKKTVLRITLDRLTGAYLAEYATKSLAGLRQSELYEKGSCQRAALGAPKF
jgi:hypothetical protein